MKLTREYYAGENVVSIARDLLGKVIYTHIGESLTAGIITETEAYAGVVDRASHAFGNRRTRRTETMYRQGGIAYVYLCYGVHHLFNFVTSSEGVPHAVLLRAISPVEGVEKMLERTGKRITSKKFTDGPGKLTQALAIRTTHDGADLEGNEIWVEDQGVRVKTTDVLTGPRIGVSYAGEDAHLPYRFLFRYP